MLNRPMKKRGRRFGRRYQAIIPDFIPSKNTNRQADDDQDLLLWKPKEGLQDDEIEEYVSIAWIEFGLPEEQALSLLYYHRHNKQEAKADLSTYIYTARPEGLSEEEKALFEKGFQSHGNNFSEIQTMFPDKSMASLILYYYIQFKQEKFKAKYLYRNLEADHEKMRFSLTTSDELKRLKSCMPNCPVTVLPSSEPKETSFIAYHEMAKDGRRWYLFSLKDIEDWIEYWALDCTLEWTPPEGLEITASEFKDLMLQRSHPSRNWGIPDRVTRKLRNFKRNIRMEKQKMELLNRQLPDNALNMNDVEMVNAETPVMPG